MKKKSAPRKSSKIDVSGLAEKIDQLSLESMRINDASFSRRVLRNGSLPDKLDQTIGMEIKIFPKRRAMLVTLPIELRVHYDDDDVAESPISVRAQYQLQYTYPDDMKVTDKELAYFAQTSAAISVWPYWREFVNSTVFRMGFPSLTLPLMPIHQVMKQEQPKRQSVQAPRSES